MKRKGRSICVEKVRDKVETTNTALKVIHTWAEYYYLNFDRFTVCEHKRNLNDIAGKCREALSESND